MRNVILTFYFLAAIPAAGVAQQSPADWKNVQNLAPNSGIVVKTKGGEKYHGDMIEVTDGALRLNSDERAFPGRTKRQREFRRQDIAEVRLLRPAASTLAGAALGGGVGAAIGAGLDASPQVNDDPHLATGLLGALGAAVGAAVGHNLTLVKGKRIYVAP